MNAAIHWFPHLDVCRGGGNLNRNGNGTRITHACYSRMYKMRQCQKKTNFHRVNSQRLLPKSELFPLGFHQTGMVVDDSPALRPSLEHQAKHSSNIPRGSAKMPLA